MRFCTRSCACLSILFLLLAAPTYAQLDTEFWLPPLWLPLDPGPEGFGEKFGPTELVITTPYASANVVVTLSNGTLVAEGVAEPGDPLIVSLSTATTDALDVVGMTFGANEVETDKGLLITADEPVQVVHRNTSLYTQSLSPLKGKQALGTDFWVGSQTRVSDFKYGKDDIHFVSVMATEDDTEVTFESPQFAVAEGNFADNGFFSERTVTLNKNETYVVRNSNVDNTPQEVAGFDVIEGTNDSRNLAGTHVTATKPVAVMGGGQHLIFRGTGDNADSGIDQIVPVTSGGVDMIGTQYIIVRGGTQVDQTLDASNEVTNDPNDSSDYALIIATEDATTINVNGSPVRTINRGDTLTYTLPGGREAFGTPFYIEASQPVYLYHMSGLELHELGMSVVPTVDCAGSRYIAFNRFNNESLSNTYANAVHVIARTATFDNLLINEEAYDAFLTSPTLQPLTNGPGGESWSTLTFDYPTSLPPNLRISADDFFHVGVVAGGTEGGTYGFLSNFARNVDILDPGFPQLSIPTNIYTVGEVAAGDSINECLTLRSCGDEHQIDSIRVSENTGRAYRQGEIGEENDECLWYVAQPEYAGNDTITVFVSNGEGLPGQVQLVFEVVPRPIAVADTFAVTAGDSVSGNVLAKDLNVEADEEAELVTDVSNGSVTLNPDGTFTYVPDPDFVGTDSLVYQVCDNLDPTVCSQATVLFSVTGAGEFSAQDSTYTLDRNTNLSDDLTANVNDPTGQGVVFTTDLVNGPENGTFELNPDGTFTYSPDEDFFGSDSVTYEVCLQSDPTQCIEATAFFRVVVPEDDDTDGDGIPDVDEIGPDPENPIDTDGDGIPDYLDPDQDITVYEGFSPGGANPTWIIEGIQAFPQNNVKVYNRWGNLVYETDGYDNTGNRVWRGNANVSNLGDDEVPDGTYFYIIDLGDGSAPQTGYVVVIR